MNKHYLTLLNGLSDAANDIDGFMSGQIKPLGDLAMVKYEPVYQSLLQSSDHYDGHCATVLAVILPAFSKYISEKFADLIHGGKYADVTP